MCGDQQSPAAMDHQGRYPASGRNVPAGPQPLDGGVQCGVESGRKLLGRGDDDQASTSWGFRAP